MAKKVLIIESSMRKNGNSTALAAEFARGAGESGNNVKVVKLAEKEIKFCRGCLACIRSNKCILQDDMATMLPLLQEADAVAFASPVYYYSICGQLKTFLDRSNPLFTAKYQFRDIYILLAAAENEPSAAEGAVKAVQGWVDCFEQARLAGVVFASGVTGAGEVKEHAALQQAYEMGKSIK